MRAVQGTPATRPGGGAVMLPACRPRASGFYPLEGAARRRAVVLLACALGLEAADLATVGATAAPLQHALRLSHTELGMVASASLLITALATLPAGALVDRVDRGRLLAISTVLWSGAIVLTGASQSFAMLLCSRLLLGAVIAAVWPAVASLLGDLFDSHERSRIWARILAGELLGTGAGFLIGGNAAALVSWRASFWFLAAPAIAVALALWRGIPDPRRRARPPRRAAGPEIGIGRAVVHVLHVPTNLILIASSVLGYFFFAGERTFGAEYLHGRYHLGIGLASTILVAIGSGALIGVFVGGRTADRRRAQGIPAARITVAATAYIASAFVFIPGILAPTLFMAGPFLFVAAGVLEAAKAPGDAARLDIMPPGLWGRAEGVRTLLRTLAQAVAPIIFGILADTFGAGGGKVPVTVHHAIGLELSLLIMLVPLIISGAVLWRARRVYPRDVERARRLTNMRASGGEELPAAA